MKLSQLFIAGLTSQSLLTEASRIREIRDLIWSPTPKQQQAISQDQCAQLKSLPFKKVAIIGAGSAGASAAYYLNEFLGGCANLHIDVYERNSYIGGRSTTVNVYGLPDEPVELGASVFVSVNHNLVAATERFNLSTSSSDAAPTSAVASKSPPELGIWDGSKFVFVQNADESLWVSIGKLLWKYGLSVVRTQSLVKSTIANFLKMYEAPYFPWTTLTDTVRAVGLDPATSTTGSMFLHQNKIYPPFSTDIIQGSSRVNYAQNLDQLHGLETMVCMAIDGAMAINGGNWQIFAEMLKHTDANVKLNTTVTGISESCKKSSRKPGALRYKVQSTSERTGPVEHSYHDVVIAAPYQYSNIELYNEIPQTPEEIQYVKLHVTLFATPYSLSPDYFGVDPVPFAVMTTLPNNAQAAANGTGATPFFSISTLREVVNPKTQGTECLYKIFSLQPISDSLLASLLLPSSIASKEGITADDALVSWKYEKVWHSYPYLPPRVKFEEFKLDDGLWYTSGIESFISTMETSSLSGMNVAASMKNAWGYPYNGTTNNVNEL